MGEDGSALSGEASRARWEGQDKNPKSPQAGPVIEIPRFEEAKKRIILPLENAEFGYFFRQNQKKTTNFIKNMIWGEFGPPLNMSWARVADQEISSPKCIFQVAWLGGLWHTLISEACPRRPLGPPGPVTGSSCHFFRATLPAK